MLETAVYPEIISKKASVHVPTYGALIAKEKRAMPELTRRIEENKRKAKLSYNSRRRMRR